MNIDRRRRFRISILITMVIIKLTIDSIQLQQYKNSGINLEYRLKPVCFCGQKYLVGRFASDSYAPLPNYGRKFSYANII